MIKAVGLPFNCRRGSDCQEYMESQRDFSNWTEVNCTLGGSTTARDGVTTLTSNGIITDATEGEIYIHRTFNVDNNETYEYKWYAKPGSETWIMARVQGTVIALEYYNLSGGGSVGTGVGFESSSITAVANGWYECTLAVAHGVAATSNFRLQCADGDGDSNVVGVTDKLWFYADDVTVKIDGCE